MRNLFLLLPLCLAGACTKVFYMPNNMQLPELKDRHDINLQLGTSKHSGSQFQASYVPFKHTAILYNGMWIKQKNKVSAHLSEFGLGAYLNSGKGLTAALFGGYGQGSISYIENVRYTSTIPTNLKYAYLNLNFDRFFLQPCLQYSIKRAYFGLGYRFNYVRYLEGKIDLRIDDPPSYAALQKIEAESPFPLSEVGLAFGIKIYWLKFGLNITFMPVSNYKYYNALQFQTNNISFNFGAYLDRAFWKTFFTKE
jgi:hypothetical protein